VQQAVESARAGEPDAEVHLLEAAELEVSDLYDVFSPSLFGGRRIVAVRDGQQATKDLVPQLLEYAAAGDPDLVLVVAHDGGAKAKALVDGLQQAGAEVQLCPKVKKPAERLAFVKSEVRRAGASISDEAAQAVVDAVGNDLRELAAACSQLAAVTDGRIGPESVARYHRGRAEVNGFTVADAAMVGDVGAALESLRWALSLGVDPVPIADAIADGVRTVAKVAAAGRANPYRLAGSLKLPPWKIERAQRQARGWSSAGLTTATRLAAELNADVKGNAKDPTYALERAVFALAAARERT
jgi:DNA polymerase-3 subunit delta